MTHILLVEDNPIDARLVRHTFSALKDWPTQITLVDDGQKAIRYLRSLEEGSVKLPELILLDVNLPKYDGYQVLAAFRNSDVAIDIPVFLFSSCPAEDIEASAESFKLRADGYFEKPCCLQGYFDIAAKLRSHHENSTRGLPALARAVEFSGHAG